MTRRPAIALAALAGLWLAASPAGQAAPPPPPMDPSPAAGSYDERPLVADDGAASPGESADPSDDAAPDGRSSGGIDLTRLAASLAAVVVLILLLKVVAGRFAPGGGASAAGRSVRVVSRTPIGPRQQVLLLQVGRRVIVACDSAGRVTTLSEVVDADEVAALLGSASASTAGAESPGGFAAMFARRRESFDAAAAVETADAAPRESDESAELGGLTERVRLLTAQYRNG